MFIGHFAVGFAAKKFAPRTSLAVLLAAPLFADLLWPVFLLLGWEQARIDPGNTKFTPFDLFYYPWSHSLLMNCVWATAFAAIYYAIARYWRGAIAVWIGWSATGFSTGSRTGPTCCSIPEGPASGSDCGTRSSERWWSRLLCLR